MTKFDTCALGFEPYQLDNVTLSEVSSDERFHVRDDGGERVAVIGIAGQRPHMGDELNFIAASDAQNARELRAAVNQAIPNLATKMRGNTLGVAGILWQAKTAETPK